MMTQSKDNFFDDLKQIRERQAAMLDELDSIKERYVGAGRRDIEQIQNRTIAQLAEIDEIIGRVFPAGDDTQEENQ